MRDSFRFDMRSVFGTRHAADRRPRRIAQWVVQLVSGGCQVVTGPGSGTHGLDRPLCAVSAEVTTTVTTSHLAV
jgi:hypothetical protein